MTPSVRYPVSAYALAPLCLAISQLLLSPPALAQDADVATTLDQITVHARQRSERLQDVPIAVTAFNAADIRDAGIVRPIDFISLTPNVTLVSESQSAGASFITIRGIAQVRNSEQPVAVVVDGVPQISSNQFDQTLFDITQVEVLKGPQGALYGNNSIGGAITITTAEPGDTPGGYIQIGGGNGDLRRAQGNFGAPLDQDGRWRGQVSAFWSDFDGLLNNEYLDKTVNNLRSRGARLRLLGEIGNNLNVDVQLNDAHDRGGALFTVFQPMYGVNDAGNAALPITSNNHGINIRKTSQASIKLDWRASWGTLTSISAWSRVNEFYGGDEFPFSPGTTLNPLPGFVGLDGTQSQYLYTHGLSQELRLTSNADQRLRWIVGAYGQFVDRYLSTNVSDDLERGVSIVKRAPLGPGSNNPTRIFFADDNANDTRAVFGQLAYDLTPKLEAALAMRYDHARRKQTDVAPPTFSPDSGLVRTATFSAFQPKLSLTWKPHDRLTSFASIGRGFNSGGFNQNGTGALAATVGFNGINDQYEQETADSYELGIKTRPLDWLELNASAFYTDLDNQHYLIFIGAIGVQMIAPLDKTRLQGVELEVKAMPVQGLTLFGSYGYTGSEIRKYTVDPSVVGNRSPYVAQSTVNLGAQYKWELGDTADTIFRVDYRRLGAQYWDIYNSSARPAVNLVDARVIVQPVSGRWSLTLWGRNLTDKQYLSEWVLGGFAQNAPPRSYGADMRFNF